MKWTTKMFKVFDAYASRKGVQSDDMQFFFDGERINADQTPEQLEMQEQDQIDCSFPGFAPLFPALLGVLTHEERDVELKRLTAELKRLNALDAELQNRPITIRVKDQVCSAHRPLAVVPRTENAYPLPPRTPSLLLHKHA